VAMNAIASLRLLRIGDRTKAYIWNAGVVLVLAWIAWEYRNDRWHVVADTAHYLAKGLVMSWVLAIVSVAVGGLIALPLAAARVYGPPGVRHAAVALIEVVRATPELMVVFWVYFTLPRFLGPGHGIPSWAAAVVGLTLMAAAYLAEVVRGGLYSVPKSQREAGLSTGLSEFETFRHIVLPQALRNMVPAFIAQLVMLFKTTSIVYAIGVIEFFRAVQIVNNSQFAPYALYITMAVVYFLCCYALSWAVRKLDPKYLLVE
jgi:polar amino acid transport system permease protein